METQTIQKLLIGIACAVAGATGHFLLSSRWPQSPHQVAVSYQRERPPSAGQKPPRIRTNAPKPELTAGKVRPQKVELKSSNPRVRPKNIGKLSKRRTAPAC